MKLKNIFRLVTKCLNNKKKIKTSKIEKTVTNIFYSIAVCRGCLVW